MTEHVWTVEEDAEFRSITDGAPPAMNGATPTSERALALLSVADLAALPTPEWLLDSILPAGGFSVLYGPSGAGKSFVALDWSLCVATGLAWYGQDTRQGWVLYIAAEGVAGLYRRIDAWLHHRNQRQPDAIRFLPTALNLLQANDVDKLQIAIATMPSPPALIVVDTMARSMTGGDENAARDVGLFIAAVDRLRNDANAAGLVVHHTGKDGEDERGSSSLRGAADTMLALRTDGANLRLECTKQKDAEAFDPWKLHLQTTRESCVIALGSNPGQIGVAERQILETLSTAFGSDRASTSAIKKASGLPDSTYFRGLRSLLDRGFLTDEKEGRNVYYRVNDDGARQLLPTTPNHSHDSRSNNSHGGGSIGSRGSESDLDCSMSSRTP